MDKILTLTFNPTVDIASEANINRIKPNHKIRTTEETFYPGGGGINVARVISQLGGNVTALYTSGGIIGTILDNLLKTQKIHKKKVKIKAQTRMNYLFHEKRQGLEYRFITEGPVLTQKEWLRCIHTAQKLEWSWLVISGSLPLGVPVIVYDSLIDLAHKRKAAIVLDTSGKALQHILDKGGMTLIKPSQREFETYTKQQYTSIKEIAEIAKSLVYKGTSKIITVSLGQGGAVMATQDQLLYLKAPSVQLMSTSGAGDSFIGGMVYSLAKGTNIENSFKLGVACAAASVMEQGTRLCRMKNVKQIYQDLSTSQIPID
ncbi:MAG: 6-phosphofructokinase 2 [Candidatus Tokpelaia sp. JSC161]|jgi:6-phosphofructokinase 2|nr:MAG: 6-phosphofructokinase 2 [Candidatus Tokpelaia sp. JSC161]